MRVPQASSLPESSQTLNVPSDADKMSALRSSDQSAPRPAEKSALRRAELLDGTHDRRYLPHWKAEGATYFVTFRLAGTLPKTILDEFETERAELADRAEKGGRKLSAEDKNRLRKLYSAKIDAYLDAGHGECWLGRPQVAHLVADSLRHFVAKRYDLNAWTIMPNHVHVVLTPFERQTLSEILHSWKSYTGTKANAFLGRSRESLWQRESYDHLVRDENEFSRVCEYTVQNPVTAGLCKRAEDWRFGSIFVPQASSLPQSSGEQSR